MAGLSSIENNVNSLLSAIYSIPCVEYGVVFPIFIVAMKIAIFLIPVLIVIFTILEKLSIVRPSDLQQLTAPKIELNSDTFDFLPHIDFQRLWLYLGIGILLLLFLIITGCLCHRLCFKAFVVFYGIVPLIATGAWLFYLYYEKYGGGIANSGSILLILGLGSISFFMMMILEGLLFYWFYLKLKPEKKKPIMPPGPGQWV